MKVLNITDSFVQRKLPRKELNRFFLTMLFLFLIPFSGFAQPEELSVNFLLSPDRVFRNGYPVQTELYEAVSYNENFQFTEIGQQHPLFGWVVPSPRNNTVQTAYRLLVASGKENIDNNIGDLWDSGKVESLESINIRYSGKPLPPGGVCFWKVKIWDNHTGESPFSAARQFKMAAEPVDTYGYAYGGTTQYPVQKEDYVPEEIRTIAEDHVLIDFGKARIGRLRVKLLGRDGGDTVTVHLGEKLMNGAVDRDPGASIRYRSFRIALSGGWNSYELVIPPHQYGRMDRIISVPASVGEIMPFRYCEIEDYPAELLTENNIQQIAVHYPFAEDASHFESSDTVLNAVWELCKHTIKAASCFGIYVDGDRERFPREADSYINQMSHYAVERGFSLARHTHEFQIKYASQWTEWILHVVLSAWADYMETGDASSMRHFYPDLKAKTLARLAREDGLISTKTGLVTPEIIRSVHWHENEWRRQRTDHPAFRDIVDWPQPGAFGGVMGETDNFEFTPINTVVNALHCHVLRRMAGIAAALDEAEDAEFFSRRARAVEKALNEKLLSPETGVYVDGEGSIHSSLHANMYPLAFGLVPAKNRRDVIDFVKSRGMACSPYGANYLLESLYHSEEADYALQLLTATDDRSWSHWIYNLGSTIALEAWDQKYKANLDWSHPWGSAPAHIIARKLMGIEPLEAGYRKIRIKPQPATLAWAGMRQATIRGAVHVRFDNRSGDSFVLEVKIPGNMEAEVHLPAFSHDCKVTRNGKEMPFRREGDFLIVDTIGSGAHEFLVSK